MSWAKKFEELIIRRKLINTDWNWKHHVNGYLRLVLFGKMHSNLDGWRVIKLRRILVFAKKYWHSSKPQVGDYVNLNARKLTFNAWGLCFWRVNLKALGWHFECNTHWVNYSCHFCEFHLENAGLMHADDTVWHS